MLPTVIDSNSGKVEVGAGRTTVAIDVKPPHHTLWSCMNITPDEADELAARLVAAAREVRG